MNKYFQNNELNLNVEKNDLCYIASGCGTDVRKKPFISALDKLCDSCRK